MKKTNEVQSRLSSEGYAIVLTKANRGGASLAKLKATTGGLLAVLISCLASLNASDTNEGLLLLAEDIYRAETNFSTYSVDLLNKQIYDSERTDRQKRVIQIKITALDVALDLYSKTKNTDEKSYEHTIRGLIKAGARTTIYSLEELLTLEFPDFKQVFMFIIDREKKNFRDYVRTAKLEVIQLLNPYMQHSSNSTILYAASDINTLDFLLNNGVRAAIDATEDYRSETLLYKPVRYKDYKKVALLLQHGANPNKSNFRGRSPLHEAVENKDYKMVQELLDHGANPNFIDTTAIKTYGHDREYRSPFHLAVEKGDYDMVKLLRWAGADPNLTYTETQTYTTYRKDNAHYTYNVSSHTQDHFRTYPALWAAIDRNNLAMVKLLLQSGANINQVARYETPLSKAVCLNRYEIAKLLLDSGANVNQSLNDGRYAPSHSALETALTHNCPPELIKLLLNYGADLSKIEKPLTQAFHNNAAAIPVLMEHGAGWNKDEWKLIAFLRLVDEVIPACAQPYIEQLVREVHF